MPGKSDSTAVETTTPSQKACCLTLNLAQKRDISCCFWQSYAYSEMSADAPDKVI